MLVFGVVMYHVHQLNLTKPYSKSTISLKLYFKYLQIVQHYSEMWSGEWRRTGTGWIRLALYGDKVNSFGAVWGLWNGAENGHLNWAVCESCEIVWLLLFSKIMPNVHSCTNWPPEKPISSAFVLMCIFIRNGISICNWRRMRTGWRRIRTNWRRTGNAEWRLLRTRLLAVFPIVKLGRKYWSNMERGHLKIMLRGWRFWFW